MNYLYYIVSTKSYYPPSASATNSCKIQNFIVYLYAQLEDESIDIFGWPVHQKLR